MNLHLYNTMVKDPVSGEMVPLALLGGGSQEELRNLFVNHPELIEQACGIPQPPTTDGTYTLKATISSGEATIEWVSE